MTKLDLLLERIRQLPQERQDAMAIQIDMLLEDEESGSLLTDEQWAEVQRSMQEDGDEVSHEVFAEELRRKFPG